MKDNDLVFEYKYGFSVPVKHVYKTKKGLDENVVKAISLAKKEPPWMLDFRLKAYKSFIEKPMPSWGPDLSEIDFNSIVYYAKPTEKQVKSWDDLPDHIKETYEKIGVPEAERKFLAGVSAQFDSEVVYESIKEELEKMGVIFCDMDTAVKKHPDIVKKYFGKLVSVHDNKFAALNSAVWSGGSFVYVPKGVKVPMPLQAYFRINAQNFGQFERTLIIAEEGAYVHYTEGCLPAGEQVVMGDRLERIELIKPGDFVVTHTGVLSRVSKVMTRRYKGKLYTIHPISPFNKFSLTEEHPVLAIKREKVLVKRRSRNNWLPEVDSDKLKRTKPEFLPISELRKGDFIVYPKINPVLPHVQEFSDAEYELLGYYLAEGSCSYNKTLRQYVVRFSLGIKEKELADRISFLIQKITGKKAIHYKNKTKNERIVTVYSKDLYTFLVENAGKYADKKMLSLKVMHSSVEKLRKLFWAYFKGDGNLCLKAPHNSKLYRISTASISLAWQIQEILARMGIFASIQIRRGGEDIVLGRKIRRKEQYVIAFTLDKRWSEIRETKDYFLIPIKDIEVKDYNDVVFNLEVEGDNSYLVKGFAVHNCTAPIYTTASLHAAVVEIFVKKGARVRYTTVQNWSNNVYNLVTKRSRVEENAVMEWVDCNIGSKVTMKYPSCILAGKGAKGEVLSIAYASKGQIQDTGAKMIHLAENTSSRIISKSISRKGGRTSYRGLVQVSPGAKNSSIFVSCDALILDNISRSDTYPYMKIKESDVEVQHEATVEKIGEEKLFYLNSRGIKKEDAEGLLVNGFVEPVVKELPLEYAVELNRLLKLEMEGSVG